MILLQTNVRAGHVLFNGGKNDAAFCIRICAKPEDCPAPATGKCNKQQRSHKTEKDVHVLETTKTHTTTKERPPRRTPTPNIEYIKIHVTFQRILPHDGSTPHTTFFLIRCGQAVYHLKPNNLNLRSR